MIEQQELKDIDVSELETSAAKMKAGGYRLVQIGATTLGDSYEVNYSFDKDYHFVNLRVKLSSVENPIPSISKVYFCAFLYENEIHDLFGIKISGIAVDYQGKLYKTTVKVPFGAVRIEKKQ